MYELFVLTSCRVPVSKTARRVSPRSLLSMEAPSESQKAPLKWVGWSGPANADWSGKTVEGKKSGWKSGPDTKGSSKSGATVKGRRRAEQSSGQEQDVDAHRHVWSVKKFGSGQETLSGPAGHPKQSP